MGLVMKQSGGAKILDAAALVLETGGPLEVQYVYAVFRGKAPDGWKDFSSEEECCWAKLSPDRRTAMQAELCEAVRAGRVEDLTLSFDPWGEDYYLSANFAGGWAAILYDAIDQMALAPCNPAYAGSFAPAPVELGGQTPVPECFALNDRDMTARTIGLFLAEGRLCPEVQWAVCAEDSYDLPWTYDWID